MTRTVSTLFTPHAILAAPYRDVVRGPDGARIAQGLLRLRRALRTSVPPKTLGDCVLLATWNIRDFGRRRMGSRSPEALAYIAEILGHFDLVAVQEVNEDLTELDRVCERLGPWWERIYTDVTEGAPGNRERLAFLYDTRTVRFSGLAGELVLPAKKASELLGGARAQSRRSVAQKSSPTCGASGDASSSARAPPRVAEARDELPGAVAGYLRVLAGETDEDDDKSVQRFLDAVKPIERHRATDSEA